MRKLGCWGSVAVALLMTAATAHADPFTVTSSPPSSSRGVDNAWFNNLIKLNGPPTATTKTYVANSIIIFGGDLVAVPNATITFISRGGVQTGFDGILFAGSVDTMAWATTKHAAASDQAGPKHAANSTSVPGAGQAYDPFKPNYSGLGVSLPVNNDGDHGHDGTAVAASVPLLAIIPGLGVDPQSNDPIVSGALGTTAIGMLNSAAPTALPTTPEPSPLWLLAGGLALAMVMKRYDLGLKRG